jgi:hypothetical protein
MYAGLCGGCGSGIAIPVLQIRRKPLTLLHTEHQKKIVDSFYRTHNYLLEHLYSPVRRSLTDFAGEFLGRGGKALRNDRHSLFYSNIRRTCLYLIKMIIFAPQHRFKHI